MKEYLSIGEVARLKKITVKALRYYEKIGIFLPAYINEETGYRYYKMEQMVVLDFILTCLELGIPLKRFPSYLKENGVLDIDLILQDGTSMVNQEVARINRTVDKLKNMSRHLEESERLSVCGSSYTRFYPERFLLLKPMKDLYPTQKQYISFMTDLYCCMEDSKYTSLYKQGLLYLTQAGSTQGFAYNEIERPENTEQVSILPAGNYTCQCFDNYSGQIWLDGFESFIERNKGKKYIFLQERYGRHLSKKPFWEIQIIE